MGTLHVHCKVHYTQETQENWLRNSAGAHAESIAAAVVSGLKQRHARAALTCHALLFF